MLALEPENEDAREYIAAAERGLAATEQAVSGEDEDQVQPQSHAESHIDGSEPDSFASGRYQVEKFIGEGGKKRVYLAHDQTLDIDVVLARIKTEGLDETGRERIRREAQAMARLGTHPNVMPIYDLREENGQPFMVQPLMQGGDVEGLLKQADGALDLEQAIDIAVQTADGLAFAHSKGIVHRDVKPGNVWLDESGSVKIGDFGLAIATNRTRVTVEKVMVGTVSYMPPEQATGGEVTQSSDIYSLGAMLYELCTGRVPFMSDDDIGVISQHINTPPVAPSWHNPQIPQSLNSLILRMLAKDPAERPSSAAEVIAALRSVDLSAVDPNSDVSDSKGESIPQGVFVGRHREMDQLKATFEEVLSGKGHMVTLVGEPGIGKTRTAQELATYARMRGALVIWGVSYEGGGEPPYWPWVRAIRELVTEFEPTQLRNFLGAVGPVIADLVPDVRVRLPDIPEPIGIPEAESARFRLFDSVTTFLKACARSKSIVVMLEDLHWADRQSLLLLEFLTRELSNSKLMIVANYRDVELSRRHPLSMTLGELGRERRFDRVLLRGLQRHDIQRFIEIAAGIDPPSALVDAVHRQTEGNPLFVTETVKLLVQEGDLKSARDRIVGTTSWEIRIPEGVREVIGRRLDRLSERCNEILTTAAVVGRQFRFPVLMTLTEGVTENTMLDALDEALASRIIEEMPNEIGLYQFTHALMQDTLATELSANRIVRMHAQIAEALENYYGDEAHEHAAELCEHFAEAETVLGPERVIKYALIAGGEAAASFAWDDALVHFQRALSAKEASLPRSLAIRIDDETATILRHLSRAQSALLMRTEAEATLRRLFEHYAFVGEVSEAVGVVYEQDTPPADLVESALDLVAGDSHDAGKLLAWRGQILGLNGDYDGAEDAFYNAMAIAQREADQALVLRIMVNSNLVDLVTQQYGDQSVAKGRRYIEIAQNAGDKVAEAEAQMQTAWNAMYVGEPDSAKLHAENYNLLAEELGLRSHRRNSLVVSSSIAQSLGEFDLARGLAEKSADIEDHFQVVGRLADIDLELGLLDSAERRLLQLETTVRDQNQSTELGEVTTQALAVLTRNVAKAYRCGIIPGFGMDALKTLDQGGWEGVPLLVNSDLQLAHLILLVQFNRTDDLRPILEVLEPNQDVFLAPFADVGHIMALGLSELEDYAAAEPLFNRAIERCSKAGYRPELAWTLADYAVMLKRRGNEGDIADAWNRQTDALEIAQELGMQPLTEKVLADRKHTRS